MSETVYHFSDKIYYNPDTMAAAMKKLKEIQQFEDITDYGMLKNDLAKSCSSKRYYMHVYKPSIDSTYFTDVATTTLAYNIWIFYNKFNQEFPEGTIEDVQNYFIHGSHDLSKDEKNTHKYNDLDIFDSELFIADALYAYYNEYEIITNPDKISELAGKASSELGDNVIMLEKSEMINGEKIKFYYLGTDFYDISGYLLQHDYNAAFLADRIPGNIFDALDKHYDDEGETGDEIITISNSYYESYCTFNDNWAAYADYNGYIVVKDNYFTETICHEFGHLFDDLSMIELGAISLYGGDYDNFGLFGKWDKLAKKYADDIYTIRVGANIGCGYSEKEMLEQHNEFFAEAFQLYFYSEETRAALPVEIRDRIEYEINKYASAK